MPIMQTEIRQAWTFIVLIVSCNNRSLSDMAVSPALLLPFVDLFAALCGNGMLESMLEPHLRAAHAETVDVGVTFVIFGCCYMLGNIFFGTVSAAATVRGPVCGAVRQRDAGGDAGAAPNIGHCQSIGQFTDEYHVITSYHW